jgi:hypothetical protein
MRAAARELEFERAAALRDEIQQIRLRVLEEDASLAVALAAERAALAARPSGPGPDGRGSRRGQRGRGGDGRATQRFEVISVEVLPAAEEPGEIFLEPGAGGDEAAAAQVPGEGTATDWLPGIRDEHDDMPAGGFGRPGDRPTWDRTVTPNVIRRTGTRPPHRRR